MFMNAQIGRLTLDVLLVVGVVLLIGHGGSGAEDLLEALNAQGFVQVPIVVLIWARPL